MYILQLYQAIVAYSALIFAVVGGLLFLVFLINLCVYPYGRLNKETKKAIYFLKKGGRKLGVKQFNLPKVYQGDWQAYKSSVDSLPSQCFKFVETKQKKYFMILLGIVVVCVLPFSVLAGFAYRFDWLFFCPIILLVAYLFVLFALKTKCLKHFLKAKNLFSQYTMLLDLYFGKNFFKQQTVAPPPSQPKELPTKSDDEKETEQAKQYDGLFSNALHKKPQAIVNDSPPVLPDVALPTAPLQPTVQNLPSPKFVPCADQKEETRKMYRIRFLVNNGIKADTADRIASVLAETTTPRSVATQKELNKVLNETLQYISKKRISA